MYAETEIMSPHFQTFSSHHNHNPPFLNQFHQDIPSLHTLDYSLWGEDDLFRAPEPLISLSPIEDLIISPQSLAVSDLESSIEAGQLVSEVFYECHKDLLAKEGNETPLLDVLKIDIPNDNSLLGPLGKSASSFSLGSLDNENQVKSPGFLESPGLDFYGMRRAFSEGDMKTLDDNNGVDNTRQGQLFVGQPYKFTSICSSEERREKLSRYWSKKSRRNFDRKIKYACRKALADSQPRVRGRFAKTEVSESWKK